MGQNASRHSQISPSLAVAIVFVACVAVLAAALLSQYAGGLQPCVLCHYQRVPYALAIALSAFAVIAMTVGGRPRPALARAVLAVCAVLFLAGAGIAGFHVGIEQGWWSGTEACSAPDLNAMTPAQLREHLLKAPIARCDDVAWSLFGVSMAGYNLLISLALSVGCIVFVRAAS